MKFNKAIFLVIALCFASYVACAPQGFSQLFVGFNGPTESSSGYYTDAEAVRKSWIASALTKDELDSVLSGVDFSHQILAFSAVGKRENITGKITVVEIDRTGPLIVPFVLVGVNDRDCKEPDANSYPFVLLAIEKPASDYISVGLYHQNTGDGCSPAKSGTPNDPPRVLQVWA